MVLPSGQSDSLVLPQTSSFFILLVRPGPSPLGIPGAVLLLLFLRSCLFFPLGSGTRGGTFIGSGIHNQHLKPVFNIGKAYIRVVIQGQNLGIRIQFLQLL